MALCGQEDQRFPTDGAWNETQHRAMIFERIKTPGIATKAKRQWLTRDATSMTT